MPSSIAPIGSPSATAGTQKYDIYPEEDLVRAFGNKAKIHMDLQDTVKTSSEKVLKKNLRVSSTAPVGLAIHDAMVATADFETRDQIGRALEGGLSKFIGKLQPVQDVSLGLDKREVQLLQRKIADRRDLQRNQLYAEYLRCPADEPLHKYMPTEAQTPKPDRIERELRQSVSEKISQAYKDARIEVFSRYLTPSEREEMLGRFNKIEEQFQADAEFASKQLSYAVTPEEQFTDSDRISRRALPDDAQKKLADKIDAKWAEITRFYQAQKSEAKVGRPVEVNGVKESVLDQKSETKVERPVEVNGVEESAQDPVAPLSPVKPMIENVPGPNGTTRGGHPTNRKAREKEMKNSKKNGSASSLGAFAP